MTELTDQLYHFALLDEDAQREIRRKLLKAVAIPGHLVPFASRDMPIARGWGTGGLQITLSLITPEDTLKVIDQGDDESVNAVNLRRLITRTTGVATTLILPQQPSFKPATEYPKSRCGPIKFWYCRYQWPIHSAGWNQTSSAQQ
jgi:Uncharacterized enzyme of phosphonate metabolism